MCHHQSSVLFHTPLYLLNIKKHYTEYGDSMQDLDLLVLGAYHGEGKGLRGRGISTFVCGVKDDKNPNIYHTVCKVIFFSSSFPPWC